MLKELVKIIVGSVVGACVIAAVAIMLIW